MHYAEDNEGTEDPGLKFVKQERYWSTVPRATRLPGCCFQTCPDWRHVVHAKQQDIHERIAAPQRLFPPRNFYINFLRRVTSRINLEPRCSSLERTNYVPCAGS